MSSRLKLVPQNALNSVSQSTAVAIVSAFNPAGRRCRARRTPPDDKCRNAGAIYDPLWTPGRYTDWRWVGV